MKFDSYEYISVIVPGFVVLIAASHVYPAILPVLKTNLTLGDLGVALIIAFVTGHLLQAVGNLLETIIWKFKGGMPTRWATKPKTTLLTAAQLSRLGKKLETDFSSDLASLENDRAPVREIYLRLQKAEKSEMIDKFNRNYGLMRGIAVAFIISTIIIFLHDPFNWKGALGLATLSAIALYRMIRFGIYYARELYVEYLNLE